VVAPLHHPGAPLAGALLLSLGVHALLLITGSAVSGDRLEVPAAPPLEVVLVNTAGLPSTIAPEVLAQVDLGGGGRNALHSSLRTLPSTAGEAPVSRWTATQSPDKVDGVVIEAQPQSVPAQGTEDPDSGRSRQLARLQAQIDQRMDDLSQLPKTLVYGLNAHGVVWADWADRWVRRVESVGSQRLATRAGRAQPAAVSGGARRLQGEPSGELLVSVEVDRTGRVVRVQVHGPPPDPELQRWVHATLQAAAPFEPFSAAMRSEGDVISMVRIWRFGHEGLRTGCVTCRH